MKNSEQVRSMRKLGMTEEERVAFYRSLSIISESLEAVSKSGEIRG